MFHYVNVVKIVDKNNLRLNTSTVDLVVKT
jgi:hypothetical protein